MTQTSYARSPTTMRNKLPEICAGIHSLPLSKVSTCFAFIYDNMNSLLIFVRYNFTQPSRLLWLSPQSNFAQMCLNHIFPSSRRYASCVSSPTGCADRQFSHSIGDHEIGSESYQIKSLDWLIWEWELPDPGKSNPQKERENSEHDAELTGKVKFLQMSNAKCSTESGRNAPNRV